MRGFTEPSITPNEDGIAFLRLIVLYKKEYTLSTHMHTHACIHMWMLMSAPTLCL